MKVLNRDDLIEILGYLRALKYLYASNSFFSDSEYHTIILDKLIRLIKSELT